MDYKIARENLGLSLEAMAQLLGGVPLDDLRNWEARTTKPSPPWVEHIIDMHILGQLYPNDTYTECPFSKLPDTPQTTFDALKQFLREKMPRLNYPIVLGRYGNEGDNDLFNRTHPNFDITGTEYTYVGYPLALDRIMFSYGNSNGEYCVVYDHTVMRHLILPHTEILLSNGSYFASRQDIRITVQYSGIRSRNAATHVDMIRYGRCYDMIE